MSACGCKGTTHEAGCFRNQPAVIIQTPVMADEQRIIRDYLASPAAEKALAEAVRKVYGHDPVAVRAILAAWVASLGDEK